MRKRESLLREKGKKKGGRSGKLPFEDKRIGNTAGQVQGAPWERNGCLAKYRGKLPR